ncbi:MAG: hypothetical protein HY023_12880 [Chloroflexi bacterium]|nr:hypothetical protein [Chloroflexota bacterium]
MAVALLLGAALACNAPAPGLNAPTRIPVSTEAAGQLLQNLGNLTPAADGSVTITMTQEQLTSLVAIELAKNPDAPVKDPQVILHSGQIVFTGTLDAQSLKGDAEIKMTAAVDENGQPDITIISAKIGPLPIPDSLLPGISKAVSDALFNQITTQAGTKIKLTSITIDEGTMTVKGMAAQ